MLNYRCVFFVSLLLTCALVCPCVGQKLDICARTKTYGGVNGGGNPEDNVAVFWIQTPGRRHVYWDGKKVSGSPMPSGVYLFEIRINGDRAKSSVYSATLFK